MSGRNGHPLVRRINVDFKQRRVLTHLAFEKSALLPQMVDGVVGMFTHKGYTKDEIGGERKQATSDRKKNTNSNELNRRRKEMTYLV